MWRNSLECKIVKLFHLAGLWKDCFSYAYSAVCSLNSPITPFHLCWSVLSMTVLSAALRRTQGEHDLSAHSNTDSLGGVIYESTSDKPHVFSVADRLSTQPFLKISSSSSRNSKVTTVIEILSWIFFLLLLGKITHYRSLPNLWEPQKMWRGSIRGI